MNDQKVNNKNKCRPSNHFFSGIGLGLVICAALDMIFNNIFIGSGIGMIVAIYISILKGSNTKKLRKV